MRNIKNFIILFLVAALLILAAYFYGGFKAEQELKKQKEVITSQVILERVKQQHFLVTKTLIASNDVEIVLENSEGWKDFFTGDKIKAQGDVRVDIGVDLENFNANDIVIDHVNEDVVVYLPKAGILNSSLSGDLDVESKKGVWTGIKDFFSGEKSDDYNRASRELISQGEKAALSQDQLFAEARQSTARLIELIIKSGLPDYSIEIKEK
ncbi:DUF4230 domain-containing protein [Candidatus Falkowbacteria bacterium]|nr:DUF4230 domain-containing protein [Candidatus Falkowbacteria bacterium]